MRYTQLLQGGSACTLVQFRTIRKGNTTEDSIYDDVLSELDRIGHSNPVHFELATYKSFADMVLDEYRLHPTVLSAAFFARLFEICLCVVFFRLKMFRKTMFDSEKYARSMRSHTDYRKFDDMLRMVIDCTDEQAQFIERMLEERKSRGQLRNTSISVHVDDMSR